MHYNAHADALAHGPCSSPAFSATCEPSAASQVKHRHDHDLSLSIGLGLDLNSSPQLQLQDNLNAAVLIKNKTRKMFFLPNSSQDSLSVVTPSLSACEFSVPTPRPFPMGVHSHFPSPVLTPVDLSIWHAPLETHHSNPTTSRYSDSASITSLPTPLLTSRASTIQTTASSHAYSYPEIATARSISDFSALGSELGTSTLSRKRFGKSLKSVKATWRKVTTKFFDSSLSIIDLGDARELDDQPV